LYEAAISAGPALINSKVSKQWFVETSVLESLSLLVLIFGISFNKVLFKKHAHVLNYNPWFF